MENVTKATVPIVALDVADATTALALVDELGNLCRFYKVGSELFTAAGPSVVAKLRAAGCDVMLDLKFHDIPNTVAGAVRSARSLGVSIVTVHAAGGEAMMRAAAEAGAGDCRIFAVTVLTSLDAGAVAAIWGRDRLEPASEVVRLAISARDAGADGVVASGAELEPLKRALGRDFAVLVPGVRLVGGAMGDQSRVVTPAEAARRGADYVVIGRAVSAAADRKGAMKTVLEELAAGGH